MAAPITHIILAEKVFDRYFSGFSKEKFFVGTSFPDIRYLCGINRGETHFVNPSPEDIKNADDVKAGMIFHSFVDEKREAFMQANGVYQLIPRTISYIQALKFLEDEVLYDRISDWPLIASFMDTITPEESKYPIKQEDIARWHKVLKFYFLQKPDIEIRKKLLKEIDFSDENILQIEENIAEMRDNGSLAGIIRAFYNNFGEKF